MKAIVNTGPGRMEWLDIAVPEPAQGQVRIKTAACGICATDLEMIRGWSRTGYPSIPGHEWSGYVDSVGPGTDESLIGSLCVAENVLSDGGEVGFEHSGGYAQFLITEAANIHILPKEFPPHIAVLIEPLAVCIRGLRRLDVESGSPVLVLGDGPIGLLMLALLRAQGISVNLVGGHQPRLQVASELGAASVSNYRLDEQLLPNSANDTIIEASGSPAAISMAMDVACTGAKILILGDYGSAKADFLWNHILHREMKLIGSNASAGSWDEAVRLAVSDKLPLQKLISERLPADQFGRGLELAKNHPEVLKVVLDWESLGQ